MEWHEALKERHALQECWESYLTLLSKTYKEVYDGDNAFALQKIAAINSTKKC